MLFSRVNGLVPAIYKHACGLVIREPRGLLMS